MASFQVLVKPSLALPNIRRPRIVGPVRKPHRDVPALQNAGDVDAVFGMSKGCVPNRFVRVTEGAEFVALILKEVRIDGPGANAVNARQLPNLGRVLDAVGEIPLHMQSDGRAYTRELMHVAGIAELLLNSVCGRWLNEFSESTSGVREPPRRDFNVESLQRLQDSFGPMRIHDPIFPEYERFTHCFRHCYNFLLIFVRFALQNSEKRNHAAKNRQGSLGAANCGLAALYHSLPFQRYDTHRKFRYAKQKNWI
jgi:hypothetical protein